MSRSVRVELDWPRENTVVLGDRHFFAYDRSGAVHVIASRCAHRGGPLHLGRIENGKLRCPWHGNDFRVDRLCARGVAVVQRGDRVIAYLPAEPDSPDSPAAVNSIVLAK
ncbi:Rieske 2Fe-2S domain-containing protein [Actinokineospora inagensis]|uniref:Rieske 2Fe-2S domain-containing protein n=1 Tax=Actinokineospora inagensis TaxID=103730 RepID=UPI00042673C0|nr:Rieske 2Fe-2S domain-containing protein [Actinokineospora inagensis]